MKKFKALALVLLCGMFLTACDSKKGANKTEESTTITTEEKSRVFDKDGDELKMIPQDTGKGTLILSNESGSTVDGKVPIVYYDPEVFPTAIDLETKGFDGSLLSYIYLDGQLIGKEQYSDTQTTIDLPQEKDKVSEGTHVISLFQYKDNDETNDNKIVTVKSQKYTLEFK